MDYKLLSLNLLFVGNNVTYEIFDEDLICGSKIISVKLSDLSRNIGIPKNKIKKIIKKKTALDLPLFPST